MRNHFDPTKPIVVAPAPSLGGPRTEAGKQISSRNSLRHGCCADTLLLKNENIDDYQALETAWFKAYSPKDDAERRLVQELVNCDWFLQRSTRTVAEIEAQLLDTVPNPLHWDEQQHRTFARFLRYQTTRANAVARSRRAVEDYRKNRAAEVVNAEKLVIQQQRLAVYKEKNKPEPTIHQLLEQMMAQKALHPEQTTEPRP